MIKRKGTQVGGGDNETSKKAKLTPTKSTQTFLTSWVKTPTSETDNASSENKTSDISPVKSVALSFEEVTKSLAADKKGLLSLEVETMNPEWLRVLSEKDIYSWSRYTPLSGVKVVVVGQDPYHDNGQAHGLCFSVQNGIRVPPSLINIYKALQHDIPTFQVPNHGHLENWAKEGVLLLNASLTVQAHQAASHSGKGWEQFTDAIIQYLNQKKSGLVFMLWGSHAQKKGKNINKTRHCVLQAVHPSPLSFRHGFLECRHWSKANEYLKSQGKEPINWNCLVERDPIQDLDIPSTTSNEDETVSIEDVSRITTTLEEKPIATQDQVLDDPVVLP
ncbi:hypothetical protein G9A89_008304 [Geosiphon pyriformis]|nr:hypothetical protein G9A89_008304 [Geosiphon pyriformis]